MHYDIWICLLHSALWICKKNGCIYVTMVKSWVKIYVYGYWYISEQPILSLKSCASNKQPLNHLYNFLPIEQYISLVLVIEVGENCLFRKPKLHIYDTFRWMWSLTKIILNTFISGIMMFKLVDVDSIHWHRFPHSTYNTVLQLK